MKSKDVRGTAFYLIVLWIIGLVGIGLIFGLGAVIIYFAGSVLAWYVGLLIAFDLHITGDLDDL